jgi:hypothetical protein
MKLEQSCALLLALAMSISCSKKSDDATNTSATANIVNKVFSTLQSATPDFSTSARAMRIHEDDFQSFANVGTNLSTANVFPDIDNPGSITKTGMEFLGGLLGSTSENSVFWRAKTPFLIACTIDALATRGNALYSTSQTSVTLPSSIVGVCGSASDFSGGGGGSLIGTSVTMTIADLADTTNYDQYIEMPGSSNSQFGGNDQWIYVRNNSTTLNFMHIEINSGNTSVSINTLHYDKSTESGFYQYVSRSTGGGEYAYRIYMNSAADKARIVASWKLSTGQAHTILAHIGSSFSSQTSAALSISFTGLGSGGSTSLDNGNACIDVSSNPPTISSDNTLTCGSQTLAAAIGAVSGHALPTAVGALSISTIRTWASTPTSGATKYPSFDDTTIVSAVLGL